MKTAIILLLIWLSATANASELFGVSLLDATRDKLRSAVKKAGATLISEGGSNTFFDSYSSDSLLQGSSKLYLGFVKKDRQFAFAEYEFDGLQQPRILQKLNIKYGRASTSKGMFLSDQVYSWHSAGITIELYPNWRNYQTRLTYYNPDALQQLRLERQQYKAALDQQLSNDNKLAY